MEAALTYIHKPAGKLALDQISPPALSTVRPKGPLLLIHRERPSTTKSLSRDHLQTQPGHKRSSVLS